MAVAGSTLTTPLPPLVTTNRDNSLRRRTRLLLHLGWMVALAVGCELRFGRFGFHPSDQGFILAQSWRLLHGEIPHADIVSARPLASAVLHTVDYVLPGPLFVASGAFAMFELTLGTVALAVLVTRRPLLTWGPGFTAVVGAAALVNLNGFPMMAWHTIDGIALIACGAWAVDTGLRTGRAWPRRGGLFLFGVAAFVKQSFLLGVVLAAAWVLMHPSTRAGLLRTWRWWRRTVVDALVLGAFPLAYVTVVVLAGGFESMVGQVTEGLPAFGERLLGFWIDELFPDGRMAPVLPIAVFAVIVLALVALRLSRSERAVHDWALVVAGATTVAGAVAYGLLGGSPRWADVLWWMALTTIVATLLIRRRVPWAALLVLVLGWMISLSWGVDTPALVAGSLALTAVLLLTEGMPPVRSPGWRATGALGLVMLVLSATGVVAWHDRAPYLDQPRSALTKDLGELTPAMSGIHTNPGTYRYIEQIRDCVRRYPAAKVAVLPDNPFVYPALGLENPFPVEWPLPLELVGDGPLRMILRTESLNQEGDYLVLFQTVRPGTLAEGGPVPERVAPDAPIYDLVDLENDMRALLTGSPVTCGSFVGKWMPAR